MRKRRTDGGSSLLQQPDLGGGQVDASGRPRGTEAVGRFAEEGTEAAPGGGGPWPTAPGEAAAAAEDGFPGSDRLRAADLVEAGLFPGEVQRGALYEGPERRRCQEEAARWHAVDRRKRPFEYAGRQHT